MARSVPRTVAISRGDGREQQGVAAPPRARPRSARAARTSGSSALSTPRRSAPRSATWPPRRAGAGTGRPGSPTATADEAGVQAALHRKLTLSPERRSTSRPTIVKKREHEAHGRAEGEVAADPELVLDEVAQHPVLSAAQQVGDHEGAHGGDEGEDDGRDEARQGLGEDGVEEHAHGARRTGRGSPPRAPSPASPRSCTAAARRRAASWRPCRAPGRTWKGTGPRKARSAAGPARCAPAASGCPGAASRRRCGSRGSCRTG